MEVEVRERVSTPQPRQVRSNVCVPTGYPTHTHTLRS
ncbi:Protein of unknown function [Pyronema omphalodes CBS 100304]|uniref:Uncharacterized protein n=1 Tax=Pyronema omphalodes (strain CBS 100304) TaxID=1076935 RepID=U4LH64_PYROM|nr:Protein of unknown function [Pyronema omphalodes CBS 100304]